MMDTILSELRGLLVIALALVAVGAGYVTMTTPMIATAGPAIITVGAAFGAMFVWRGGFR
jgi:hypothetical protein